MKNEKLYLIQFNLRGLHDCVYTLRNKYPDLKTWWDKSGEIDADPEQPFIHVRDGITQILFKNKTEAERTLKVLLAYRNHIRSKL